MSRATRRRASGAEVGQGRPDPQGGGKRRDEARNRKGNRGGWKAPSRLLPGEVFAGTWLPSVKAKVAPSTVTSYRQNITQVANRIGHVRLDALDPPTLDALYADLEAAGSPGRQCGCSTLNSTEQWPMRSAGICAMAGR